MRTCSLALALLVAASALTGCRESETSGDYAIGDGDEYVAMGDSYAAAPGTGALDGNDGCLRSQTNYPHQVAAATGADLTDVSCSAATSDAVIAEQVTRIGDLPPQVDALSEDTELVTIGIGANDFNLIGRIVLSCVALSADAGPGATPCTDTDHAAGRKRFARQLVEVEEDLVRRLSDIAERAPQARILVIGYPQIFPPEGNCEALPITEGDVPWAHQFVLDLNRTLRSAAQQTSGAEYVDVFAATRGHHICADDAWIAGSELTRSGSTPWHPYPEEQEAVAELILAKLE